MSLRLCTLAAAWLLCAITQPTLAADVVSPRSGLRNPPSLPKEEGERHGKALVEDLLSRRPEPITRSNGTIRIRTDDGRQRRFRVDFALQVGESCYTTFYEAFPNGPGANSVKLTIRYTSGTTNEYLLEDEASPPRKLTPAETMIGFAGSDFWIADLGMEFLRWPEQRVLRKEMRKSMPCDVLESVNPSPTAGGYSRVISWISPDAGAVVHADAYDSRGELVKQFDPTELGKVDGQRTLEEMEMRNRKTRSESWFRFNLEDQ
jgi:hypothetical protein